MRRKIAALAATGLLGALLAAVPTSLSATAQEGPPLPLPDPVVHEIQITGPASERMNLIILGDGYQWDQQSIFLEDVDRNLAVMWATEPLQALPQLHERVCGRDRLDRLRRPT